LTIARLTHGREIYGPLNQRVKKKRRSR